MECATDDPGLGSPAPTEGSLAETPLPTLLISLAKARSTGVLRLEGLGDIWLDRGRLYLATAPSSAELSKVLFDANLGCQDDIAAAMRHRSDAGPSALDALLDSFPESAERAERLLHEHNLGALFEMLVPRSGGYLFEPDVVHSLGPRFAEDTEPLLDKAQRRTEIWRRIASRIPSTTAVFTLASALPASIDERVVTADEWRFLARLNGSSTVADVINQTGESAFRVCSSLYRLLLEEVIEEAQA